MAECDAGSLYEGIANGATAMNCVWCVKQFPLVDVVLTAFILLFPDSLFVPWYLPSPEFLFLTYTANTTLQVTTTANLGTYCVGFRLAAC